MNVAGKIFVVTGGGSGMGRELVLQLLRKGATVAAVDLRQAGLDEVVGSAGSDAERTSTHVTDIADLGAVRELLTSVLDRHGHVDGLFNNAGIIQPFVKLTQLDDAQIERVMNVNFYGTLNMIRVFLPQLLTRPEAHIVNTSSMGGFLPVPGQAIYGASKAAVKLLTEALYAELLDTSVRVTAVFPGAIATKITENSGVRIPVDEQTAAAMKTLSAADAAAKIIAGMERDHYHVLVGSDAYLMDKLCRLTPKTAARLIQKQMKPLLSNHGEE